VRDEFADARDTGALAIACLALPATAAASTASFDDPIGDSTYYAPDLGATTVLKQEGIGIYAKWVLRPEVVVECTK
jgi:hypothetical protein